jgi:hypothetical protein
MFHAAKALILAGLQNAFFSLHLFLPSDIVFFVTYFLSADTLALEVRADFAFGPRLDICLRTFLCIAIFSVLVFPPSSLHHVFSTYEIQYKP